MHAFTQFTAAIIGISVLAYVLAVIVIVFFHELGHFMVARWCGVRIEAFSIGFGREVWGFFDRHGTRWKLSWIPLGGYVRFEGDANAASLPDATKVASPTSLQGAKLWKRFLIVLAGPMANFVLSIVLFSMAFALVGIPVADPRVGDVVADGAAAAAGIKPGDMIRMVDGREIKSFGDIQESMILRGTEPLNVVVDRDGQSIAITLTPKVVEVDDGLGGKVQATQIGIRSDGKFNTVRATPIEAVQKGVSTTWFVASTTMRYVERIFLGRASTDQLHGPVGVAKVAGDTAMQGLWPYVFFIGLISVSIGLVNLFPIPMLDGGHLLFYMIEAVSGRPISPTAQEWSFRIGLSAILVLLVLATTNDAALFFAH